MGPLTGIKVIELAGLGPAPYGAMLLADLGAEVLRIDRPGGGPLSFGDPRFDVLNRGRRSVAVDLKHPSGPQLVLDLAAQADVVVEGFRPGVVERLGIGPDECRRDNSGLVYARMTGWGQRGPLASTAGHDIDYIAVAGVLSAIGREGQAPVPPLNLVADFGGGGVFLALGVVAALVERARSGEGQVVDVAMVDGAASLTAALHGMRAMGMWADERGTNLLDTGAPFYDVYATADGGYMAVGALEPAFYAALLHGLDLDPADLPEQYDRSGWPALRQAIAARFAGADRAHWEEVFTGTDACVAPVLGLGEAASHPHNRARSLFIEVDGVSQPAPAPRFERTPGAVRRPPPAPGADTREALADWGIAAQRLDELEATGAIVDAP